MPLGLKAGDTVAWRRKGNEVRLLPARFTLESAFKSVKPWRQPEDFQEFERAAKAAKAESTVDELRQDHNASSSS